MQPTATSTESASITRTTWFLVALTLLARLYVLIMVPNFAYEDALITLRMTVNAAHGENLVYNIGQHALGTTTPLFAWLMTPCVWLTNSSASFLIAVRLACILMDLASVALIYRLFAPYCKWLALATGAFFAVYPSVIFQAETGMETSLYVLLIWASLFALDRSRHVMLGVLCGLLLWCRPDGLIFIAVALAYLVWQRQFAACMKLVVAAALTLLPWTLYTTWYYGSVIPSSLTSKIFTYGKLHKAFDNLPLMFSQVLIGSHWHRVPWLALALLAVLGIGRDIINRKDEHRWLVAPALWVVMYFGAFAESRTTIFPWYLFPIYPFYMLLALAGLRMLLKKFVAAERLDAWKQIASGMTAQFAGAVVVLVVGGVLANSVARDLTNEQAYEDRVRKPIGLYVKSLAKPGDVVMMEPIGYIGYYSELRVLDVVGLVSPEITKEAVGWPDNFGVLADKYQPRFAVLRDREYANPSNASMHRDYRELQHFEEFVVLERK